MMKKISIAVILAALLQAAALAQSDSGRLFSLIRELSASSPGGIWPGFDAAKFTELKEGYLQFSPEPGKPESQIFMTLSDEYFADHTVEDNIVITVHEAFHGFQRSPGREGGPWGAENAFLVFEYAASTPRNNALFAIEARLLLLALRAEGEERRRKHISDFLAVRRTRQRELPAKFVEFERGAELNEGLAEYAGVRAVLEALRTGAAKRASLAISAADGDSYLSEKFETLETINRVGSNVRRKFYLTGSAQAVLLDRLMPGEWKRRVQMEGASVQDLLEEAIDPSGPVLRSMNYEDVFKTESEAAEARTVENRKLLHETLSEEGVSLKIDFSKLGGIVYVQRFDPMNVTMIEPGIRVHTRMVRFGKEGVFSAAFDKAVVEDLNERTYRAVISGGLSIRADGVKLDPNKNSSVRFSREFRLVGGNVEVTAKTGIVSIEEGRISMTIEGS
ncbi:MAG TPA: hypothetical protein VMM38_03100 [Aridibacter sp.]|nr:hypothetical protein [Aridibacter sp.]